MELLPCPFCGGDPIIEPYYHGKEIEGYTVACPHRGCVNPQISLDGEKGVAIKAWNIRPAPPATKDDALIDSIMTAVANCPDVQETHHAGLLRREIKQILRDLIAEVRGG